MNRKFLTGLVTIAALLLGACGDDEKKAGPNEHFSFDGETVTLKKAKIYLVGEGTFGPTHLARRYVISDGVQTNGDFNNYTYYMELELAVPVADNEFTPGEFPLFENFGNGEATAKMSYVSMEVVTGTSYVEYYAIEGEVNGDPIVIAGGFDDGETMSLDFDGALTYSYYDEEEEDWLESTVNGKFFFNGKVIDITSQLGPQ